VLRTVAFAVWVMFLVLSALAVGYDRLSSSHLFPGTRIGEVVVGSRSLPEAERMLTDRVVTPLRTAPIKLRAHTTLEASAWALGMRVEVADAVRGAYERQRSISLVTRLWYRAFGDESRYPLTTDIDRHRLDGFLASAAKRIDREPRNASVKIDGATLSVVPHEVGRRLHVGSARARIVQALRAGDDDVRLPVEFTQPELRKEQFNKVLLIDTGANRLDLYLDGKLSKAYPVATGTPGYPTPHGQFHITSKRMNPTWGNPWADWSMNMPAFIGPGPGNPLGTRAMNLSAGGIRIHGTPNAASIGGPASHGCIRMYMRDAEELFDIVDVGTPVVIVS
jgi:hypothetical protein